METRRYPIGIQTFEEIREGNYVYVDKTEYVYNMTRSKTVFLCRPRRFGKSLLVSTLKCYFEGRKELFRGLAIERLEREWSQHPVIRLDMSGGKHLEEDDLKRYLLTVLDENAERLGVNMDAIDANIGLMKLIKGAHDKYGQKVVLLIDEYDAPLLDVVHEDEHLKNLRLIMRNLYSPIKKCDDYLRFVFLTGITKFSQMSIFSELNSLANISMTEEFAAICGITEEEMLSNLDAGIEALAEKLEMTKDEAVKALKDNYDGYHFSSVSPDIYNPFSLLNALRWKNLDSYWFTGTPSYLLEMLRKYQVMPSELCSPIEAEASDFDASIEQMTTIVPLLYQSGYITIKDYERAMEQYTLGIPNREIRIGLMKSLLPHYLGVRSMSGSASILNMQRSLLKDDINQMLQHMQDYLATVPYVAGVNAAENREGHWQQMLYLLFSLLGARCDVEVHTQKGRIDLVAQTAAKLYLIEVKLNKSAKIAVEQINLKDYAARFALSTLPVVKVGVSFDLDERNIKEWKVV